FGGGLERLTAATLNNPDIFMIDVFDAARTLLEKRSNKPYIHVGRGTSYMKSFRIILDHTRAASVMFDAGLRPSNTEQGYVLRRLIRRSIIEADKLGIKEAILGEVAGGHKNEFNAEEAQFRKTLAHGMRELEKHVGRTTSYMDPEVVFMLYTTYGFPIELTAEIAKERGKEIDLEAVKKKLEEHQALSRAGAATKFAGGLADHAEQTVRYHTAHHLLLKALQTVLGPDVHQRGSNITSERLRIDFSYGQKMTDEQKKEVEKIVNEQIQKAIPVEKKIMSREEADKLGAEHEFGAKYPDMVSVYIIGSSIEFCGGPHAANTGELGRFKIQKEEASSASVRRIKAILE
ncbi:MAG: alanine--tRNA ligase-related protein, partial [Patescibacteria group bacterium]